MTGGLVITVVVLSIANLTLVGLVVWLATRKSAKLPRSISVSAKTDK